jgi:hypothetical protein
MSRHITSFSWRMKSARELVSSGRQINMLRLHESSDQTFQNTGLLRGAEDALA